MGKPSKTQRARLIDPGLRAAIEALSDDALLAVHDLTHDQMMARHGTNNRGVAQRVMARKAQDAKLIGGQNE